MLVIKNAKIIFENKIEEGKALILSDKIEGIVDEGDIPKGVEVIDAMGGYSRENKKILMVSFTMDQYAELMAIVTRIDKDAFMTINRAHEINGEGWTKYDLKKKK